MENGEGDTTFRYPALKTKPKEHFLRPFAVLRTCLCLTIVGRCTSLPLTLCSLVLNCPGFGPLCKLVTPDCKTKFPHFKEGGRGNSLRPQAQDWFSTIKPSLFLALIGLCSQLTGNPGKIYKHLPCSNCQNWGGTSTNLVKKWKE